MLAGTSAGKNAIRGTALAIHESLTNWVKFSCKNMRNETCSSGLDVYVIYRFIKGLSSFLFLDLISHYIIIYLILYN